MKACVKCGESKPSAEFHKAASNRDGLYSYCKSCSKVIGAAWLAANPEKSRAKTAKWAAANPEKARASVTAYHAANRKKVRAKSDEWKAANPEKVKANKAAWREANPEACRIYNHNRRARKREAGGKLSKGLTDKLFKLQRGKCACGCKQPLGTDYHMDHRMPLALGGTNTDDNMQLLRSICNQQKYMKHPVDFMQQRGFLL